MTRINLVDPAELTDQHLFAEFREIKMVPRALARSLANHTTAQVLAKVPQNFTLNTGHVMFFYNKGKYLQQRYDALRAELSARGVAYNKDAAFDPDGVMLVAPWYNDYKPTARAFEIIRTRIAEKIAMKPTWYKMRGMPL